MRKEVLITKEELVAQWGMIRYLPPKVGTGGSSCRPVYHPETGALKELGVIGTALSL